MEGLDTFWICHIKEPLQDIVQAVNIHGDDQMKCKSKGSIRSSIRTILRGNEGTSIVLVSIMAVIIITCVVILRMVTSSLWASADKQYNQDQAYMLATTCGKALEDHILAGKINLDGFNFDDTAALASSLPNASIRASASLRQADGNYVLTVTGTVGEATYVYTALYSGSGTSYTRVS